MMQFNAIESNPQKLFPATTVGKNHILVVLTEILRKDVDSYRGSFVDGSRSIAQKEYTDDLQQKITGWVARIDRFLNDSCSAAMPAEVLPMVQAAQSVRTHLHNSLPAYNADTEPAPDIRKLYYRMLGAIRQIQQKGDDYLRQIESCGTLEPALALLLVFIRNYCEVADRFNKRLSMLPQHYRSEIVGRDAPPLPERRSYRRKPMPDETTQVVSVSQEYADERGWMLQSPLLLLQEGNRILHISFHLSNDSVFPPLDQPVTHAFYAELVTSDGVLTKEAAFVPDYGQRLLVCSVALSKSDAPVVQPTLRLLAVTGKGRYEEFDALAFDSVTLDVSVDGITGFNLRSEWGDADATLPFTPFGTQGERGGWFAFDYDELSEKKPATVTLSGKWDTLPPHPETFRVRLGEEESTPLFVAADEETAQFTFFPKAAEERADTTFRVTLTDPTVGFGITNYYRKFAEAMTYNSRHKKHPMPVPELPTIPKLSKLSLAYTAVADGDSVSLYRIAVPYGATKVKVSPQKPQRLPDAANEISYLYFRCKLQPSEHLIDLYFILPDATEVTELPVQMEALPALRWSYYKGDDTWSSDDDVLIVSDETDSLTRNGNLVLRLAEAVKEAWADKNSDFWLRLQKPEEKLAPIDTVYLNCPIVDTEEDADATDVENSGYVQHRNRAVTLRDYEMLVAARFPELERVYCFSEAQRVVRVVIFSREGDSPYPCVQAWKLRDIRTFLTPLASPAAVLQVCNPTYEFVEIVCIPEMKPHVTDTTGIESRMTRHIEQYYTGWITEHILPEPGWSYSYKGLHSRLANDDEIVRLRSLTVNGVAIEQLDIDSDERSLSATRPWHLLRPHISIFPVSSQPEPAEDTTTTTSAGIGKDIIGINFSIA
jgi:hypothetical protein